jgi:hypothetical protein
MRTAYAPRHVKWSLVMATGTLVPFFSVSFSVDPPVSPNLFVTVLEEEGNCIVCLEMRAHELMRRLISGELTNYSVVRTSPEPLHYCYVNITS